MPDLITISRTLSEAVNALTFAPPIDYVYNPLDYAREPHEAYLRRYGVGEHEVLFVGMNPGPFGMAQTGVPFGDIVMVREWLGIEGAVGHPPREHPKRPVEGFAIRRREGSGTRLWGWARERFGTPEAFFARYFVMNYCPLLFLTSEAGNVTPDKLRVGERAALFAACDAALRATVVTVGARLVVGVGAFARDRALAALAGADIAVGIVLHPSPANPRANAGWARLAEEQLHALGAL